MASRHPQKSSVWPGAFRCAAPRIARWKACEWTEANAGSLCMTSALHEARGFGCHVGAAWPVAIVARAQDGRAVVRIEILGDGAYDAQQRAETHAVLPHVVLRGEREEGVGASHFPPAHRHAARLFVIRLAEISLLQRAQTQGDVRSASRPGAAVGHDAEEPN